MVVKLLGTSGTLPLPDRYLSSAMLQSDGYTILLDCGENTQISAIKYGFALKKTDAIFLTHLHADHIIGLPGVLQAMSNANRKDPLAIYGPYGIKSIVDASLRFITTPVYPILVNEITVPTITFKVGNLEITAFEVNHSVSCYGYSITKKRPGVFDAKKAAALKLNSEECSILQNGGTLFLDGRSISCDEITGPERKSLKFTYCTDTRPCNAIIERAVGSDLFVCEGMYGPDSKLNKAVETKHLLFSEAATLAKNADVKKLCLTHYTASMRKPVQFLDKAKQIFENTICGYDGLCLELKNSDSN